MGDQVLSQNLLKTLKFSIALVVLVELGLPSLVRSQASASTTSTSASDQTQAPKKWLIEIGLERSSNFRSQNSADLETATGVLVVPAFLLTDRLTLSGIFAATQQDMGPRDTLISDSALILSLKGQQLNDQLFLAYLASAVAPTSKKSQDVDRLKFAGSLATRLNLANSFGKFSYTLGLRRNFHEFVVNSSFSPNLEYILSHRILVDIPIYKKISFASDLSYRNGRTYRNFERQSFSFSSDLVLGLSEALFINLGITNEGSATKANGNESNLDMFNENTSVMRAGVSYVL